MALFSPALAAGPRGYKSVGGIVVRIISTTLLSRGEIAASGECPPSVAVVRRIITTLSPASHVQQLWYGLFPPTDERYGLIAVLAAPRAADPRRATSPWDRASRRQHRGHRAEQLPKPAAGSLSVGGSVPRWRSFRRGEVWVHPGRSDGEGEFGERGGDASGRAVASVPSS